MAADAAVTFLLEKVTGVIKGYADLISAADKEFKELQNDLKLLQASLQDFSRASSQDQAVREMQDQVREVVYVIEDSIDSWLMGAAASKGKGTVNCFGECFSTRSSLAKDVKTLREGRVKEICDKIKQMRSVVGTSMEEQPSVTSNAEPVFRQEAIVGRKDEIEKITGYLTIHQTTLDVISIIGMPGLGKTALAWEIFNCVKIQFEFPIRIWVDMSQRTSSRDALLQIMKHFMTSNSDDLRSMSDREMLNAIHAFLSRDKFLLVMDDVWRMEQWDQIKNALPYSSGTSKVLLTSREMEVGRRAQQITNPYEQLPLDSNESWELLQRVVFGEVGKCPKELKDIGEFIAGKCEGVPLAIMALGYVLKDCYLSVKSVIMVKQKWMEMANNVNLALNDHGKIMHDAVALSYKRLPDHLRECFLYLGIFPAGFEIPAWTLTRLWIAEGFIQPDVSRGLEEIAVSRGLEEIAENNLNDLISRNLLKVRKMNPMHEVKVCIVHDLIREFCVSEAAKHNIFQEIKMEDHTSDLKWKMQKIRRLCLHSDLHSYFSEGLEGPHVRSFVCFGKNVIDLEPAYNSVIPENFPSLRILQCKSIKFNQFPHMLTKLKHLRYIVLCVHDLKMLPESLSQLWNLQTIIVDTYSNSVKMEANIWKMIRLRHVKTKAAIVLDEKWKGSAGDNLHTLNRLSPESVTRSFSQNASNLRTLGVRGDLSPLFENMSVEKLYGLEKLKLYHAVESENRLRRFPDDKRFPPNLRRLTLSNTFLEWKHMSTIAMISHLEVLKLKNNAFTGIHWDASNYGFTRLLFLLIVNTDFVLWEVSPTTFPELRFLVLKNCENLKEIPDLVLQCLENLEIDRVRQSAADSARNSGAQFNLTIG